MIHELFHIQYTSLVKYCAVVVISRNVQGLPAQIIGQCDGRIKYI
jgi:hypothetical protein